MNGKVSLQVSYGNISYSLEFDSFVSVLSGDSGTGKSFLCYLIAMKEADELGHSKSAVEIKANFPIRVLPNISAWRAVLADIKDSLVFIDDNCSFTASEQFSSAIKDTSNYYVIINRSVLCGNLDGNVYKLVKDNTLGQIINVPFPDGIEQ